MKVTAIFDIGRTNKKFFLFDQKLREVHRSYTIIDEIKDEDGFPCDDILAITQWIKETLNQYLNHKKFSVGAVNFSAYGASLVHIDRQGNPVAPLYSYLKPIPPEIIDKFYNKYGDQWQLAQQTCSPPLDLLNSGLQLYWLKYVKPKIFHKITWSLHLPQYLSYLFTGMPVSDFTSIGCHTMLWNFNKKDYHSWVYAENLDKLLPPIVETSTMVQKPYLGQLMKFGVGIHDSSAALLPYFIFARSPFLLVSTGTWSISMNPSTDTPLSSENLQQDVLKFMQIDGKPVRAARLFLGNEYNVQVNKLLKYFNKKPTKHRKVKIDWKLINKLTKNYENKFNFSSISTPRKTTNKHLKHFKNFKEAYHQLMLELVELQIHSCELAIGKTSLTKLYIDGGFIDNDLYIKLLTRHFADYKIETASGGLGSAIGAAIVISDKKPDVKLLTGHYELKRQKKNKIVNH